MFFFFCLLALPLLITAKCPLNGIESTTYNTCYIGSPFTATWIAAESICKNLGGHLPYVKDAEHNLYLANLAYQQFYWRSIWLGANIQNKLWTWTDGKPFTYSNFIGGPYPPGNLTLSNNSVSELLIMKNDGTSNGNVWTINQTPGSLEGFMCEIPFCNDGISSPSLLSSNATNTGLFYISDTKMWYYGNHLTSAQASIAESNCKIFGGHLPSISNGYQNEKLVQVIEYLKMGSSPNSYVSIGYKSDQNGIWSWLDGNNATYQNWALGQPGQNAFSYNSLINTLTGRWYAEISFDHYLYLCELPSQKNYCA